MEDKSYELSNQPAGRHGLGNDHIILCDYSLQTSDGSTNTHRVMPSNSEQEQLLSGTGMVSRARGGMVLGQGDALKLITNADNATISTITLASGATSSYKTTTGNKILKYDFDFVPKSGIFAWEIGNKVYELKDHLGNVRSLIADYRAADGSGNPIAALDHYAHYYPFGMMQPGRNGNRYRYGFSGHEKVDEVLGTGNLVDMGDRWLDVRLGRTSKPDRKAAKFPGMSPYSYAANNPIYLIDPDGEEIKVHREKAEDGTETVVVTITAKMVSESSRELTDEELQDYADRFATAFAESYTGEGENVKFKGVANITLATDEDPITESDHVIRIVDQGKIPKSEGRKGVTGRAPFGENVIYLSEHIIDREEATKGDYKGTGKTEKALATLERTGPHEAGHSANMKHPSEGTLDGNLMHQTRRKNAGKKLTEDQILQIEKDYKAGKLNQGKQKVEK